MKALAKWVRAYGDETSVHGIKYITWIHENHPFYLRLIWLCVVSAGFFCAGYLIRQAFIDWDEQQVITTIDSVAAPFSDIQFPTVTVCNDDQTMPDGWALVAHLVNFWKFECYPNNPNNKTYPHCNETMELRRGMGPFMTQILHKLRSSIHKFVNIDKVIVFGGFDVMKLVNDAFNQPPRDPNDKGPSLPELIKTIHQDSIGVYYGEGLIDHIKDMLSGYSTNASATSGGVYFPTIESCQAVFWCGWYLAGVKGFIASTGIVIPYDSVLPVGNMLRTFARFKDVLLSPLPYEFESDEFNGVNDFAGYVDYEYEAEFEGTFNCSALTHDFLEMHELFMELSQGMGIPKASLLDLPQLIGSQGIKELSKREPTFYKFPFTFCQDNKGDREHVEVCMKLWKDFMEQPWEFPHPCDNEMDCCHKYASPDFIGRDMVTIMKAMKYAYHSAKSMVSVNDLRSLTNKETSPYPITEEGIGFYSDDYMDNMNTMMPHCKLGNRVTVSGVLFTPKCEDFKPVVTNRGICYAYNAEPLSKFAVQSSFTDSFDEAFKEELGDANADIRNNLGAGKSFGLEFWLDNQAVPFKQTDPKNSFVVGMSDKEIKIITEMTFIKQALFAERLFRDAVMEVSAEATESSEGLRAVDIDKRKCRFEDELTNSSLGLFKIYTQASCQFECMLEYSAKSCRCVPWNLPSVKGIDAICDAMSNYCFDVHMRNVSQLAKCDCPTDCNRLSFKYKITENSIDGDLEALCEGEGAGLQYMKTKMKEHPRPYQYHDVTMGMFYYPKSFKADTKFTFPYQCKKMMQKSMADVKVLWSKPYYIKYRQDKRVTFVDQISALGGTLGLFTGMSFLSVFELVFWLYRGFIQTLFQIPTKRQSKTLI